MANVNPEDFKLDFRDVLHPPTGNRLIDFEIAELLGFRFSYNSEMAKNYVEIYIPGSARLGSGYWSVVDEFTSPDIPRYTADLNAVSAALWGSVATLSLEFQIMRASIKTDFGHTYTPAVQFPIIQQSAGYALRLYLLAQVKR